MIRTSFIHSTYLAKKIKIISSSKTQVCLLYSTLVKKTNFFFILVLQRFSFTLSKVVKSNVSFIFKIKIFSKRVFHLILIEMTNLVKSLDVIQSVNFSSFSKRQTSYSLIRSPFVFKKSQEQLSLDRYTGSFRITLPKNSFLVSEYVEFFILQRLQSICLSDITMFKDLKAIRAF